MFHKPPSGWCAHAYKILSTPSISLDVHETHVRTRPDAEQPAVNGADVVLPSVLYGR